MTSGQPPSPPPTTATASTPSAGPKEYRAYYALPEHFHCKEFENSSSIQFDAEPITGKNGKNAFEIKGFYILVTAENEADMLKQTDVQAERLAQIMTLKSQGYVKYTYDGYSEKTPRGTWLVTKQFTMRSHRRGMIDQLNLNSNQAIKSIMENDENTNTQLFHARRAIKAAENSDDSDMYKELFQVIEKQTSFADYNKWKSLRHALSHQRPVEPAKDDVEKYFGKDSFGKYRYEFTANNEFNHFSHKNRENLKQDADELREKVMQHLTPKLG